MPEPQGRVEVPGIPEFNGTPFAESQTAGAASVNTITLAAVPGSRLCITQIVATATQIAVVNGVVTITNVRGKDGAAKTMSFQFVESAAGGALMAISFFPLPLFAQADNQAMVVSIPAIGSGATTALTVIGIAF